MVKKKKKKLRYWNRTYNAGKNVFFTLAVLHNPNFRILFENSERSATEPRREMKGVLLKYKYFLNHIIHSP